MKTTWQSQFAASLLKQPLFVRVWKRIRPAYHATLKNTVYRNGIPKSLGTHIVRLCFENRRVDLNQYTSESDWMLASIGSGMTVLDVGANLGVLSILFARKVGSQGKIFAFEPSPTVFNCLQKNIHLNQMDRIITACNSAVSHSRGTVDFFVNEDPYDTQHSLGKPPGEDLTKVHVTALTLDFFCKENAVQPDVLKIDVEGYEPFVLEGARNLIAHNKNLVLFIELHPWVWPSIGYDAKKFNTLLNELHLQGINEDGTPLTDMNRRVHVRFTKIQ
jgi:FkbM family methyltransferase